MSEGNREAILADFQACTGIHDIEESIVHLQNCDWDLLRAINRVVPEDSQTLPSERNSTSSYRPTRNNYFGMDQDPSESDVSRMDDEDIFVVPTLPTVGPSTHPSSAGFIGPQSMDHLPSAAIHNITSDKLSKTEANKATAARNSKYSLSSDFLTSGPSSSKNSGTVINSNRDILFCIRHGLDQFEISLAECETIETLKTLIQAQFEIPPCQQTINGWPKGEVPSDSTRFGVLSLPNKLTLTVESPFSDFVASKDIKLEEEEKFQLQINDGHNETVHIIGFPASQTIGEVKQQLFSVSDIPVRLQIWTGWPEGCSDEMKLSACGLEKPTHIFTLKKQLSVPSSSIDLNKRLTELTDGSETSSDVEDLTESYPLEEDYFVPEENHRIQQKFLISDNVSDEATGTIEFADNFAIRYGSCHPMFFHGTLEDAVREACHRPAKNRKLLAIYLHHDASVMSNVFCQHILCDESVVSYMTNNFVVWGWDVTNESNRQLLLAAVNRNFGPPGVAIIRSLDRESYPVIIIVSRVRSATEVRPAISGTGTVDELISSLMTEVELYHTQQKTDIREEEEREARERVKREQDEAYEASLNADRAKDEAKRALEQQKINEEQERLNEIRRVEEERAIAASLLPPEPGSDCQVPVCSLKCRLPGGKTLSRKFIHTCPIKILFNFLFAEGYSTEQFKVLTSYPKRDLTTMPEATMMKEVFSAQDTFIVEER